MSLPGLFYLLKYNEQRKLSLANCTSQSRVFVCLAYLLLNILINKVTLVVEYLGWVDLDLGCSIILLGQ